MIFSRPSSVSTPKTIPPSLPMISAVAFPIPLPAAVISATLFSNLMSPSSEPVLEQDYSYTMLQELRGRIAAPHLTKERAMATYVLIHGAYQGGWIWKPVATRLRAAGHLVFAPTLDGCGERKHTIRPGITVTTQAQEVAQHLFYEDLKDVVLVGTSSGGMVVCKAAELARDRIARLAFVDALALLPGEKVADIVKGRGPRETTDIASGPTAADAQ